ncbi:hypothetical protein [endosymbiont GvMRE of Glomus versiforme]|uniref:hypothetical protein n=1 Tax=endosymbiont GvMRE of Glomus versiforme TaxID=2039283 RepID=UPI0011C4268E|nr:hypothetical protein [endosymbiont GvMRE of Glomus versiforme]
MTKTNELLPNHHPVEEMFYHENYPQPKIKNKSRRWKYTLPDLIKQCFICDNQIKVKYNLPRKKYSQKNLWGYWTEKPTDQEKYICNSCLKKNLLGRFEDWGVRGEKSRIFHVYLSRNWFETIT